MSSASDQDDTDGGSRLHARIIQTADSIQEIQDISPELPLEVPDSQPGSPLQREIPDSQESLNNFDSEYEEDFPIGDAESLPPANEVCQNLEDETDLATRHWSTSDEEHLNPSDYDLDQQPASNFGDSSLDEGKFDNEIHENKNWSNDATNDHSRDSELVPGGTTLTPRTKLPIVSSSSLYLASRLSTIVILLRHYAVNFLHALQSLDNVQVYASQLPALVRRIETVLIYAHLL